jgi:hypothetical protein
MQTAGRDREDQLQREVRRDPQALGRLQPGQQVSGQDRQVREGQGQGVGFQARINSNWFASL